MSEIKSFLEGKLLTPEGYALIFLIGFIVGIIKNW